MTKPRQPVSFIATTKPKQAESFYRDVLGLTLVETSPYALVFTDGAHTLRIQIVSDLHPASHTVHGWQVADIASEISALSKNGAAFLRFDQLNQDAAGVWTTPDGNKIAWFKDPCGNVLSLTELA
jgi:catechol 2,3-dioxygenase-like lactoylglutathione lyase family enzyme